MTVAGGAAEGGTVFELSPGSNGVWNEQILFSFNGGSDGGSLDGGKLTLDGSGNIYGTCFSGGAYGFGVVFELTSAQMASGPRRSCIALPGATTVLDL
jgi:hypothetical protein